MATFQEIKKNLVAYIKYVQGRLKDTRRDFPSHKELTASHETTMDYLGRFLGDLNILSQLNQDISIRNVQLRILEHELCRATGKTRRDTEVKDVVFYMGQLKELQMTVLDAKKAVETQVEAIRSIQSAKKTYDKMTGVPNQLPDRKKG